MANQDRPVTPITPDDINKAHRELRQAALETERRTVAEKSRQSPDFGSPKVQIQGVEKVKQEAPGKG
jgi:hypothetical protein